MGIRKIIVLLVSLSSLGPVYANRYETMQQSTVRLLCAKSEGEASSGSGFMVTVRHVVTNWHVVDCTVSGGKAGVMLDQDTFYAVEKIVWKSATKDLAVLQLAKTIDRPVVSLLTSDEVETGEKVHAVGFPGKADSHIQARDQLIAKITDGIISGIVKDNEEVRLYQIDAAINPGNSGGPLFNDYGEVIGVNSRKALTMVMTIGADANGDVGANFERVPVGEGIGWAVQIDELLAALDEHHIRYQRARHTLLTPIVHTWQREPLLLSLMVGVLLMSSLLLFRRPRQQVVEALSRRIYSRPQETNPQRTDWRLEQAGQAPIPLSMQQLQAPAGLVIGRSQNVCDVAIHQASMSQRHLRLQWANAQLWAEDLNSSNGSILNGNPIKPYQMAKVCAGDELRLADVALRIS